MPKVSELENYKRLKVGVYGKSGAGKTSLFRTLPGKKFVFVFDPAGLASYEKEDDIEFEEFIPHNLSQALYTVKGDRTNSEVSYNGSEVYSQYEKFYNEKLEEGFFSQFDWVCYDSITTLQSLMMDEIARIYGREGKNPDLADYGLMSGSLNRCLRNLVGLPTNVLIICHEQAKQDKLLRTVDIGLMVPGQQQVFIPLLFSDFYHAYAVREGEDVKYFIDTAPTSDYPLAKCSIGLPSTLEVTIDKRKKDATSFGLGKFLKERR